jgi:transcriptional regulator with XRE-family HTH domain
MEPSKVAARLRRTLKDCGLSQAALEQYGLPYRTVQNYVSKNQMPGGEALTKIRDATGVNIDWLLTGEGEQFEDRSKMQPRPMELADIQELMGRFTDFADYFVMRPHVAKGGAFDGDGLSPLGRKALLGLYTSATLGGGSLTEEHARVRDEVMPDLKARDVDEMTIAEVAFALQRLEKAWEEAGLPIP